MNKFLFVTLLAALIACNRHEAPRKSNLMYYHDPSTGKEKRVKTMADWDVKRAEMQDSLEAILGPLPSLENLPPLNVQYRDSLKTEYYTRYTLWFTAAENEKVPAYLYIPVGAETGKKFPAMLVCQETQELGKVSVDGGGKPDRAYAKELAQRGFVVIAADYPSFGELKDYDFKNDRYLSGTMVGIFYHRRCIDVIEQLPCTDMEHVGVIGLSLGGHNSMYVSAFEPRIRAIVSVSGWCEHEYFDVGPAPDTEEFRGGGRLWGDAQERYYPLLRDKYHFDDSKIPYQWHEVIALLAPRPFLSVSPINDDNFNVEGVRVGIDRAMEAYRFLHAENSLQAMYPEEGHVVSAKVRVAAYDWIDSVFQHTSPVITEYY